MIQILSENHSRQLIHIYHYPFIRRSPISSDKSGNHYQIVQRIIPKYKVKFPLFLIFQRDYRGLIVIPAANILKKKNYLENAENGS